MAYGVKEADEEYMKDKINREKAQMKYPKIFDNKVNIKMVNMQVIRRWIYRQLSELLPDDDVVMEYACEMLQQEDEPDIKSIHLQMQDFLGSEESMKFCKGLWKLLCSAQEDREGIPPELVEEKKREYEEKQKLQQANKKTNYNRRVDLDAHTDRKTTKVPNDARTMSQSSLKNRRFTPYTKHRPRK